MSRRLWPRSRLQGPNLSIAAGFVWIYTHWVLTAQRANDVLSYNPETGVLLWKRKVGITREERIFNSRFAGKPAGEQASGYVRVSIDGRVYYAHRVIWLMVHGTMPRSVDHKDLDPSNNRLDNLRLCNQSQNMANGPTPSHNTSGIKGVYRHCRGDKWVANIKVRRRCIYLGVFDTLEEASSAYRDAAVKHFGEFARSE